MQHDHVLKKLNFDLLTQIPGSRGYSSAGKIFAPRLLQFIIPFNLICNMTMFWKSWGGGGGGRGIWGQNISYHVAASMILLNLMCNVTVFWKSWILTFWPQPLSPPRRWDTGLRSKIIFDMFHIYCTSVCMRSFGKNIDNLLSYCEI